MAQSGGDIKNETESLRPCVQYLLSVEVHYSGKPLGNQIKTDAGA